MIWRGRETLIVFGCAIFFGIFSLFKKKELKQL